jgi:hypothetical protein
MKTRSKTRSLRVFGIMISMTLGITSWIHAQAKVPVTHEALWLMPRVGAPVPASISVFNTDQLS